MSSGVTWTRDDGVTVIGDTTTGIQKDFDFRSIRVVTVPGCPFSSFVCAATYPMSTVMRSMPITICQPGEFPIL